MAEPKTKLTKQTAASFIKSLPDAQIRADCAKIVELMKEATRAEPQMWGTSIVGFGIRRIKYAGGREGDWPLLGFSPRKQNLTLYLGSGAQDPVLLEKLGKHSLGKGCLYIKRLSEVDVPTLKKLMKTAVKNKKG